MSNLDKLRDINSIILQKGINISKIIIQKAKTLSDPGAIMKKLEVTSGRLALALNAIGIEDGYLGDGDWKDKVTDEKIKRIQLALAPAETALNEANAYYEKNKKAMYGWENKETKHNYSEEFEDMTLTMSAVEDLIKGAKGVLRFALK